MQHPSAPESEENAVEPQASALPVQLWRHLISTQRSFSSPLPLATTAQDVEHVTKTRLHAVNTSEERRQILH